MSDETSSTDSAETAGRGLPTWFKVGCAEASIQAELAPGHDATHADAGYALAIHWTGELDAKPRALAAKALRKIRHHDTAAFIGWMETFLPDFLSRVPVEERANLALGFFTRLEE